MRKLFKLQPRNIIERNDSTGNDNGLKYDKNRIALGRASKDHIKPDTNHKGNKRNKGNKGNIVVFINIEKLILSYN